MLGYGLALGAAVLWGVGDFLGGFAARSMHVVLVVLLAHAAGVATLGIYLVGRGFDTAAIPFGIELGLLSLLTAVLFYRALAIGPMMIVAPLLASSAALPVIWSRIQGEPISHLQAVGMLACLVGTILAAVERSHHTGAITIGRGPLIGLGATLLLGVYIIVLDGAVKTADPASVLWVGRIVSSLGALPLAILILAARVQAPRRTARSGLPSASA